MSDSPDGSHRQSSLEVNPGVKLVRQMFFPVRGVVTGVHYRDTTNGKRTYVDLYLYGPYPPLKLVPLLHSKINDHNGEQWTPEKDDSVAVAFFGGSLADPVVIGYLPPHENEIEAKSSEEPRYHRRINKCDEVFDKEGSRTTIIDNAETTTIKAGDWTVTVESGKCTVTVEGKTAWTSHGTIELDGGVGKPEGNVQGDCICAYTGKPHPMRSQTVKSSL